MRYAISYLSTADIDLHQQEVEDIMRETNEYNNGREITGILLYNERSFFQLIEGEKKTIKGLYEKIAQDSRQIQTVRIAIPSVRRERR